MRSHIETLTILACVLMGAVGQILLKLGASNIHLTRMLDGGRYAEFLIRAVLSPVVASGFLLYGLSAALWLVIMARSELSYAYPFISIGFVITTLFGWLAFGEAVSATRLVGVGLIIAGVIFVARS